MVNYGLAILLIHVVSSLINRPAIFVRHLKLKCQTQDGGGAITKKILTPGTGLNVDVGDILEVEYKAYIKGSNTPFAKGKQNNFVVKDGSMIRCWDMAVATMKVNEYAMFDCKADYAYGKNGIVNVIPPNADILLEIKVLAFLGNKLRPERSNWNTPETAVQAAKGENKVLKILL